MRVDLNNAIIGTYCISKHEIINRWEEEKDKIYSYLSSYKLDKNKEVQIDEVAEVNSNGELKISATLGEGAIELASITIGKGNWHHLH